MEVGEVEVGAFETPTPVKSFAATDTGNASQMTSHASSAPSEAVMGSATHHRVSGQTEVQDFVAHWPLVARAIIRGMYADDASKSRAIDSLRTFTRMYPKAAVESVDYSDHSALAPLYELMLTRLRVYAEHAELVRRAWCDALVRFASSAKNCIAMHDNAQREIALCASAELQKCMSQYAADHATARRVEAAVEQIASRYRMHAVGMYHANMGQLRRDAERVDVATLAEPSDVEISRLLQQVRGDYPEDTAALQRCYAQLTQNIKHNAATRACTTCLAECMPALHMQQQRK